MKRLGQLRLEKLKVLIDNHSDWMMVAISGTEYARIELVQKSRFHEYYAIIITKVNHFEYDIEDGCVSDAKYYEWFRNKFETEIARHLRGTYNQLKYGSADAQ